MLGKKPLDRIEARDGVFVCVCTECPPDSPRHFHLHTRWDAGISNPFYSLFGAGEAIVALNENDREQVSDATASELLASISKLGLPKGGEEEARGRHTCAAMERVMGGMGFMVIEFGFGSAIRRGSLDEFLEHLMRSSLDSEPAPSGTEPIRIQQCEQRHRLHAYVMSKTRTKVQLTRFSSRQAGYQIVGTLQAADIFDVETGVRLMREVSELAELPETDDLYEEQVGQVRSWCEHRRGAVLSLIETGTLRNEFNSTTTCGPNPFPG